MRSRQDLGGLSCQLVEVTELSRIALEHVTAALCDQGPAAGSCLPDAEKALYALHQAIEDQALAIGETRVRPATGLRTVVATAQVNADAEGVGVLARRLVEIAGSRPSRPAVPAEVQAAVCGMGRVCLEMLALARDAAGSAPADTRAAMGAANAELHRLRQRIYRILLDDLRTVDVDAALDASLACRYYLQCAEHAVSMARHTALAVQGTPG
ncbi:hypothetical protein [Dactylosporangium sp. NPDC051484]|uniref:hypothetical protein n=1 Tax=Dactylosporangium sp. NPDC051484 TaxID=3154942 RepID=UPI00344BA1C0